MEAFGIILKAAEFAADKHRDQQRKNVERSPYINHPIEVCRVLWDIGAVRDPVVLAAALLHDTIEDTETTPEELEGEFGADICKVVLEVSDDGNLPKADRKRQQIEHAPSRSEQASLVKLADKYCNVRDMADAPPAHWHLQRRIDYVAWARAVVEALPADYQPKALRQLFDDVCDTVGQRLMQEMG